MVGESETPELDNRLEFTLPDEQVFSEYPRDDRAAANTASLGSTHFEEPKRQSIHHHQDQETDLLPDLTVTIVEVEDITTKVKEKSVDIEIVEREMASFTHPRHRRLEEMPEPSLSFGKKVLLFPAAILLYLYFWVIDRPWWAALVAMGLFLLFITGIL
ncbi:hypothetical protein [Thaumasiovibrio subtropicus]|uniref:hypothetical protein n=1 Tax=Thaumasiovibrio subtropicus TaxID=1891207 RepID=UPI001C84810B|nr:hypothetical protein [Thaumasiovibrio subtropicus]